MIVLYALVFVFVIVGAIDYIIGNKLKVGEEFERAFKLLSAMALSMIGMIVLAPTIGYLMGPVMDFVSDVLHLDPSILPAMLLANDMGGEPLANQVAKDEVVGMFNGLIVASMMGCTISFTIPFALGIVKKENQKQLCFGLLCGVVTIPVGCFVSGLMCGIHILTLIIDLLPIVIFSTLIALALIFFPNACVKVFKVFGFIIKTIIIFGFVLGIYNFFVDKLKMSGSFDLPRIPLDATVEEGAMVCLNASLVMAGMFPLVNLISRLLKKPLGFLGGKVGIDDKSAIGLVATLATSATSFGMMDQMNEKGVMVNSAFAVSAAFSFCAHMGYTMGVKGGDAYLLPMIVGKLVAGVAAVALAFLLFDKLNGRTKKREKPAKI